jgi:hypothetical protein
MPLILGANTLSAGGYEVDNSLRFNDGSSDYLSRTQGTGNRKTWTYSVWIKRSQLGTNQNWGITQEDAANNNAMPCSFNTFDKIDWYDYNAPSVSGQLSTNRVFRDTSAWYHIVLAVDTTNATADDRMKMYVNGVQETSFATRVNPSLNYDFNINVNTKLCAIGAYYTSSPATFYDGYMSEINFIDGQQLAPSDFGEFDEDSGIWKPIAYEGTYGTNGFYLEFKDSSALGDDTSGTGNDFTVNNLTSVDQSTDTPTNNFATNNPLNYTPSAITYTEGNLKLAFPASWNASISSIGVSAGKWYWEAKAVTAGNNIFYGIMTENATTNTATPYTQIGVLCGKTTDGDKYLDTTYTASGYGTSANGDILGFALDLNSGTKNLTITKNGAAFTGGSVNLTSNFNSVNIFAFFAGNSSSAAAGWEVNYGSPMYAGGSYADAAGYGNFSYEVPAGYFSLCTKNLAEYG